MALDTCSSSSDGNVSFGSLLWLFAPRMLFIPFGFILWGVDAGPLVHWFGCVFAMGVAALANTTGLQLSVSYCIVR